MSEITYGESTILPTTSDTGKQSGTGESLTEESPGGEGETGYDQKISKKSGGRVKIHQ